MEGERENEWARFGDEEGSGIQTDKKKNTVTYSLVSGDKFRCLSAGVSRQRMIQTHTHARLPLCKSEVGTVTSLRMYVNVTSSIGVKSSVNIHQLIDQLSDRKK